MGPPNTGRILKNTDRPQKEACFSWKEFSQDGLLLHENEDRWLENESNSALGSPGSRTRVSSSGEMEVDGKDVITVGDGDASTDEEEIVNADAAAEISREIPVPVFVAEDSAHEHSDVPEIVEASPVTNRFEQSSGSLNFYE